jgi:hypothetical protein
MKRRRHLGAELLEERALLSSLAYSLTTDRSVYQVGQPIQMTFRETNTGAQPVTVQVNPTDFFVSQNSGPVWQSNPGTMPPSKVETLNPGQSLTQTATWDGTTVYTVGGSASANTWHLNHFGTFSVSNPNGPPGLSASFQISDPEKYSLTTDKQVYQLGEPVQATFTEVNTAPVSITVPSPPPEAFQVYQDGKPLWLVTYPGGLKSDPITLTAGKTITVSQTLLIIPGSGPYTLGHLTGSFDVTYGPEADPTLFMTPIQVAAPPAGSLTTSVTTDQSTYSAGQPVNLTFTETNQGSGPISILTGANAFEISQAGMVVWQSPLPSTTPPRPPVWSVLQPGQSYSQKDTWNGLPDASSLSNLTGPFTATNQLDPNADTASFQIGTPTSTQLSTSLTTDQSVYHLGQPVTLNFSETNVGTVPIKVMTGPVSFTITQNGTQVWTSIPPTMTPATPTQIGWMTLQPGQSYSQQVTWNGVPGKLPSAYPTGTFTVSNAFDPNHETATFQIAPQPAADLVTKIITNQSVYDVGEPVEMALIETNVSQQPIFVLTGPTAFQITHNGSVFWNSTNPVTLPGNSTWESILPGHSYTQALTWQGSTPSAATSAPATGQFTVSNLLDPSGTSVTFQINPTIYVIPPPITMPPVPVPPVPPVSPPSPVPPGPISPPSPAPNPNPTPVSVTASLVPAHPAYKPGQAVRLTMILKNASSAKVVVGARPAVDGITVMQGSTVVYRSGVIALLGGTIKPHASMKLTLLWSGRPNQPGLGKLNPGTYTITVVEGGYSASTTIRILGRG